MRPAWSVILFTVTSGIGLGAQFFIGLGYVMPRSLLELFLFSGIALVLIVLGLLSSTLHLGHPMRAIKAFSQWRSSWLSREGVFAVMTIAVIVLFMAMYMLDVSANSIRLMGWVLAALSVLTIFSTAMIYASLKSIASWHHYLTPFCYLGFGLAGGGLLLYCLKLWFQPNGTTAITATIDSNVAIFLLVTAWLVKCLWWQLAIGAGNSTMESATGLGKLGKVKLMQPPHTEENWLQHEMVYQIARKHAQKLRLIALAIGCIVPVLLLWLVPQSAFIISLAFLFYLEGLLIERWLFFAEAKHTVGLYYGQS